MASAKSPSWLLLISFLAGCDLVSGQYPLRSTPYPPPQAGNSQSSITQSQSQVTGSQRTQHMWDTAMQGMFMGAAVGGIYGAGGGLLIGLISGFFSADAHYTQLNNQIQLEQTKTNDIEKKIEEELQRQRELEAQLGSTTGTPLPAKAPEPAQPEKKPADAKVTTVAGNDALKLVPKSAPAIAVASLTNKKETLANPPASPFKNVEVRDMNGDGVPDLWIYYNPLKPGEIIRQEEASHWDGRVDAWSYFRDGRLVRREVDTKGKGAADTVYHYENDKIIREERDESGSGQVTYRAMYQNGRRAKLEQDTQGRGKTDHWIYYDTTKDGEIVLKEERDLDGDGLVDLWSYYENGRLVRRDLSAVGLELLSKEDRRSSLPADSNQVLRPAALTGNWSN